MFLSDAWKDSPIMPTTPVWPRMNPNLRNIRILNTFKVTGTKTPANVPSLSVPPTGLGNAPGLGFEASLVEGLRLPYWLLDCDFERDRWKVLQNQLLSHSMP